MNDRGAKKSDAVEVRVTHETKQALLREAKACGLSLSALLRAIIEQHLRAPAADQPAPFWEPTMLVVRKRPLAAASAFAAASFAVLFSSTTPSLAEDLALQLNLELRTEAQGDKNSWRVVENALSAEYGEPVVLSFPGDDLPQTAVDRRQFRLTVRAVEPDREGKLRLDFTIEQVDGAAARTIAAPSLLVASGNKSGITVKGWDDQAAGGKSVLALKVRAKEASR